MKKIIYTLVLLLPAYWSLSGQEVVEVIELENLVPGLHILKATDGQGGWTGKFVKQ